MSEGIEVQISDCVLVCIDNMGTYTYIYIYTNTYIYIFTYIYIQVCACIWLRSQLLFFAPMSSEPWNSASDEQPLRERLCV